MIEEKVDYDFHGKIELTSDRLITADMAESYVKELLRRKFPGGKIDLKVGKLK